MHADYPLISVVIPTYNQARYLPICIDSVWFQSYPNLEIIVVNAASTDNTAEVLEEYSAHVKEDSVSYASCYNENTDTVERIEHDRYVKNGREFRLINLCQDPGLSETYNRGVALAKGKYVTTIVSDDIAHPMMISRLFTELEKGFDFVYSDIWIVDDVGRIIRQFNYPDFDAKKCLADWYLMGSSKLWLRELNDRVGFFDPNFPLTQDYDLFFRFAMEGARITHVPEVLYSVRWHGQERKDGNHSKEREPKIFTESKVIAQKARKWLAVTIN